MMLYIQQFLQTLLAEVLGVACVAGVLYVYWNAMTKKEK
mgnify:FL=1